MARKPNWPPRRRPHKASGQERVRFRGRDYYLGPVGSREADLAYQRLLAELAPYANSSVKPPPSQTFSDVSLPFATLATVFSEWLASEGERLGQDSHQVYQYRRAMQAALDLFAALPAAEFDEGALERVQLAMAATLARKTVNRRVNRLKTIWRWAERRKLVPKGSWANLRTLPGLLPNDRRVRHLPKRQAATEAQVDALLAVPCRPVLKAMVEVQWLTGMRSGEVRVMRGIDVDRSGAVWVYRPQSHKGTWRGRERAVAIGPRAQAVLGPFLASGRPEDFAFRPPFRGGKRARLYSDRAYSCAVTRLARRAGLIGFCAYMLRHGAKQRITREYGLDAARSVLGQSSISTTNDYGDACDLSQAVEAMARLG